MLTSLKNPDFWLGISVGFVIAILLTWRATNRIFKGWDDSNKNWSKAMDGLCKSWATSETKHIDNFRETLMHLVGAYTQDIESLAKHTGTRLGTYKPPKKDEPS